MNYELRRQPNGSWALYHAGLRETMHPHLGPWEEANRLYVAGSGLEAFLLGRARPPAPRASDGSQRRAAAAPSQRPAAPGAAAAQRQDVVVFDVGLGGAANALAAIACRAALARSGRAVRDLTLVSFERDLEALAFAIEHAERLPYVRGSLEALRGLLDAGQWSEPGVRWSLRQGDFARSIREEPCRADVVFFDPFSHRTNPELWSVPVLESVYRCRRPGSGQRLVTYSSALSVRAALLLAGYYVGDGVRLDGRPTTIAATDFADLAEPLDERWLQRWRKERDPWPALTPAERHPTIRAALLAHPQWGQLESRRERGASRRMPDRSGTAAAPARRRRPVRGTPHSAPRRKNAARPRPPRG